MNVPTFKGTTTANRATEQPKEGQLRCSSDAEKMDFARVAASAQDHHPARVIATFAKMPTSEIGD
jgi:hypothetical protein